MSYKTCSFCKSEILLAAQFCSRCGSKQELKTHNIFYGKDLFQMKSFSFFRKYFDILVYDNKIYLIETHTVKTNWFALLFGLIFFNLVGLIIAYYWEAHTHKKERALARKGWLQETKHEKKVDQELISENFRSYVIEEIELLQFQNISEKITCKGSKITIYTTDQNSGKKKKIVLQSNKKDVQRIESYLNKNVL